MRISLAECTHLFSLPACDADAVITSVVIDGRQAVPGSLFVAIPGERTDGHAHIDQAAANGAVAALVMKACPDSPIPTLQVADTTQALGQLAHWWRKQCSRCQLVAVTGSCGKSTTKHVLRQMLSAFGETHANEGNYNNELGAPLSLLGLESKHQYAVIEMGAGQAGDVHALSLMAAPNVSVITTIGLAHVERLGGLDGVAHAKAEIVDGLARDGALVVNADVESCEVAVKRCRDTQRVLSFGYHERADVRIQSVDSSASSLSVTLAIQNHGVHTIHCELLGAFNAYNIASAVTVGMALGLDADRIVEAMQGVKPMGRRMQAWSVDQGATLIDDAYNANPTAMKAALDALSVLPQAKKILVMGDMLELGEGSASYHQAVGADAKQLGVTQLLALGSMSAMAAKAFGAGATHFDDHASLVAVLQNNLDADTVVLVKGSNGMKMHQVVDALRAVQEKE